MARLLRGCSDERFGIGRSLGWKWFKLQVVNPNGAFSSNKRGNREFDSVDSFQVDVGCWSPCKTDVSLFNPDLFPFMWKAIVAVTYPPNIVPCTVDEFYLEIIIGGNRLLNRR